MRRTGPCPSDEQFWPRVFDQARWSAPVAYFAPELIRSFFDLTFTNLKINYKLCEHLPRNFTMSRPIIQIILNISNFTQSELIKVASIS